MRPLCEGFVKGLRTLESKDFLIPSAQLMVSLKFDMHWLFQSSFHIHKYLRNFQGYPLAMMETNASCSKDGGKQM
jgi:hypothetical protein